MSMYSDEKILEEFVVFLRNSDILTTTQRGVTTQTDNFTASGSQIILLSKNNVRNIRSATISGASASAYRDFTPDYSQGAAKITIVSTIVSGTSVSVVYDYSSGTVEKVWHDFPEVQYLVDNVPRIGMGLVDAQTDVIGIGSPNYLNRIMLRVKVYDKNVRTVEQYAGAIRSAVKTAQKSFYHFPFVKVGARGPCLPMPSLANKVFEKTIDLYGKFNFES